jgi:hypothetical protein
MQIFDLNGHVLRFGAEPKSGEPEGAWLTKTAIFGSATK